MSEPLAPKCAVCGIEKEKRACGSDEGVGPEGCPTIEGREVVAAAMEKYADPEIAAFARAASLQEAAGYADRETGPRAVKTRVEEICEFAERMRFRKLGIAFCSGLILEGRLLHDVLTARGFEVVSVVCKAGCVPKAEIGLGDEDQVRPGRFESMCNPISQAEFLNRAGTELNIMMGLCVGHDSLFLKHAEAYTTVLAAKDRVTGHNPLAALYTSGSYYRRLMGK